MNRDEYKILWDKVVIFIDNFRRNPNIESLQEVKNLGTIEGAFYAGLVEKLSIDYKMTTPAWVYRDEFYLKEPVFPNGLKGESRIYTALECPLAFKLRNIFIGLNTFDRC